MYSDKNCESRLNSFINVGSAWDQTDSGPGASLPETLRNFRRALGYELVFARAQAPDEASDDRQSDASDEEALFTVGSPRERVFGTLRLSKLPGVEPRTDWDSAKALASSLAHAIAENCSWRSALAERTADYGALVARCSMHAASGRPRACARLRDVLRSGCAALGSFEAAMITLLDETASALRPVAVWRLPEDRLLEPDRPLRGSRGDLEALLGNAVVLNDETLAEEWKAPEIFPCSVCIPIISDTAVLGTAWFFSNKRRRIETRETEILGLISGRIVDELERSPLPFDPDPRPSRRVATAEEEAEIQRWVDSVLRDDGTDEQL